MKPQAHIARSPFVLSVLAALTLLTVLPGTAAANSEIAEVQNYGTLLAFEPFVEYDRLVLTVTGPCDFQFREVFDRSSTPVFKLNEETIDGTYTYSLKKIDPIDNSILDVLAQARKLDDNKEVRALCRAGKLPGAPAVQSHGFLVAEGKIVFDLGETEDKFGVEGPVDFDIPFKDESGVIPFKDFVINDDLIVDGSACIGFDCVNGESFSFDTIRLKENNLRIKFDDTSVAASFPRTDWQLTANASANGGASKFSIDDISGSRTPFTVEANARSHSLYVDDGGRIGNRTSTPSTEIHTIDGDTPTLRLQQDGSSGFAPQTWDVAGNETNFFVRDVSNGSTLPFRIRPGAPTSAIFVDVDGDVGMGTASPDGLLHIDAGTGGGNLRVEGNNIGYILQDDTSGIQHFINNDRYRIRGLDSAGTATSTGISLGPASGVFGVNCNDGAAPAAAATANFVVGDGDACDGVYTAITAGSAPVTSSSRDLKENLQPIAGQDILQKIAGVGVYAYDFIDGPKDSMGLMAEDFHQVFGRGSDKMISSQEVQMALWLAVQKLTSKVETLEAELVEARGASVD
ncbi:MAG: tail fiber domain-containing protein [Acidobacteriota bacterium]